MFGRIIRVGVLTTGILLYAGAALCATPLPARIVVMKGDSPIGDARPIQSMRTPSLNDAGQVAFTARFSVTPLSGLYLADVGGAMAAAREGQSTPAVNGIFGPVGGNDARFNNAGQLGFEQSLFGTLDKLNDFMGVYRADPQAGTIVEIARGGRTVPDGNGLFKLFGSPRMNEVGQLSFRAELTGASLPLPIPLHTGLYRGDGQSLVRIARGGQGAPGTDGVYGGFSASHSLNNAGEVGFIASIVGGSSPGGGVFRSDGTTATLIARNGQAAPNGPGQFSAISSIQGIGMNDDGAVAFTAMLSGAGVDDANDTGLYRGGDALVEIARAGQVAPGGILPFSDFKVPVINDSGQVAFIGELGLGRGIYLGDGLSIAEVARQGGAGPGGLVFGSLGNPILNDVGHVAFSAFHSVDGGTTERGVFRYDANAGLVSAIQTGDTLLGSTVIDIGGVALNAHGQLAYYFELSDGRAGLAVTAVPEPITLSLIWLVAASLIRWSRAGDGRLSRSPS